MYRWKYYRTNEKLIELMQSSCQKITELKKKIYRKARIRGDVIKNTTY
jgi:hypothetical protein